MQHLHLVGFTAELDGLIFSTRRGSKSGGYVVSLDDRLLDSIREAVRLQTGAELDLEPEEGSTAPAAIAAVPELRRLGRVHSALSPKDIQARLRAGRSVAEVADEAEVDESWILRFASPVLAEQSRIVERALQLPCRANRKGESAEPLDVSVTENLIERGTLLTADEISSAWSAYHVRDSAWVVRFRYVSRRRQQVAQWAFDLADSTLVPINRLATELGYLEPGRRKRRLGPPEVVDDRRQPGSDEGAATMAPTAARPAAKRRAAVGKSRAGKTAATRRPAKAAAGRRPATRTATRATGTSKRAAAAAGPRTATGASKRTAKRIATGTRAATKATTAAKATRATKTAKATRASKAAKATRATKAAAKRTATKPAKTGAVGRAAAGRVPARKAPARVAPAATKRAGTPTKRAGAAATRARATTKRAGAAATRAGATKRAGTATKRVGTGTTRAGTATKRTGMATKQAAQRATVPAPRKSAPRAARAGTATATKRAPAAKAGSTTARVAAKPAPVTAPRTPAPTSLLVTDRPLERETTPVPNGGVPSGAVPETAGTDRRIDVASPNGPTAMAPIPPAPMPASSTTVAEPAASPADVPAVTGDQIGGPVTAPFSGTDGAVRARRAPVADIGGEPSAAERRRQRPLVAIRATQPPVPLAERVVRIPSGETPGADGNRETTGSVVIQAAPAGEGMAPPTLEP